MIAKRTLNAPGLIAVNIQLDTSLTDPSVIALLESHLAHMRAISPPESVHALDLDALRHPNVRFWTLWRNKAGVSDSTLAGCGALQRIDAHHGEIKSMRTASGHERQGVATALLRHLLEDARAEGLTRLSLETGSTTHFAAARALYTAHGFTECGPFAGYNVDPHSTFMTRTL